MRSLVRFQLAPPPSPREPSAAPVGWAALVPVAGARTVGLLSSPTNERSTVTGRDAWLPFAVAALGLALLLGVIQVPDVDGALAVAIGFLPLAMVLGTFV